MSAHHYFPHLVHRKTNFTKINYFVKTETNNTNKNEIIHHTVFEQHKKERREKKNVAYRNKIWSQCEINIYHCSNNSQFELVALDSKADYYSISLSTHTHTHKTCEFSGIFFYVKLYTRK